jgi:hypothetical protein
MKSQFGKYENEVIKCGSQTPNEWFVNNKKHFFGLLDMKKKNALNFSISTSKIHLAEVPSLNSNPPCRWWGYIKDGLDPSKANIDYCSRTATRWFQRSRFDMRHEKAKWVLSSALRCLFGRLARAMTTKRFSCFQIEFSCQNLNKGEILKWPYFKP